MIALSSYNHANNSTSSSSLSFYCSVSGSNTIIFVGVNRSSNVSISSVTYAGTGMTLLTTVGNMALFYLINPATGNNQILITLSGNVNELVGNAVSFNGVSQSSPIEVYNSAIANSSVVGSQSAATPSVSLVTAYDADFLFAISSCQEINAAPSVGSGMSLLTSDNPNGLLGTISEYAGPVSPASNTVSATWVTSSSYTGWQANIIAIAFKRTPLSLSNNASVSIMNSASPVRKAFAGAGTTPLYPPVITIRQKTSPFSLITGILNYIKTSFLGTILPVLNNEQSDPVYLRIYNDFDGLKNIADAVNVEITTWDGNALTASMAIASQGWLNIQQDGFGEGSSGGALFTYFPGSDLTVGGNNIYSLQYSSNGLQGVPEIRSCSNFPGAGFVELKTYIQPKLGTVGQSNNFIIAVSYSYSL